MEVQVQEDFAYGISAELTRVRTTERVTTQGRALAAAVSERTKPATDAASQQMNDLDSKYHVTEQTSAALKVLLPDLLTPQGSRAFVLILSKRE